MHIACRTTSVLNHMTVTSRTTEIWPFEFREISTFGEFLNCRDNFRRRKIKNRSLLCCRPGPMLSPPTISVELHANVAEEIDLEMCSYRQLSEVQMLRDVDLDHGPGQGHINIHSALRSTTSLPIM